jgi:hypothetical protein
MRSSSQHHLSQSNSQHFHQGGLLPATNNLLPCLYTAVSITRASHISLVYLSLYWTRAIYRRASSVRLAVFVTQENQTFLAMTLRDEDYINKEYGSWLLLRPNPVRDKWGAKEWYCKCTICGEEKSLNFANVRTGLTTKCRRCSSKNRIESGDSHIYKILKMAHEKNERKVINLDTGEKFPSIIIAASTIKVNPSSISVAIKNKHKSGGYRWAYYDETNKEQ